MKKKPYVYLLLCLALTLPACTKEFLDKKPNKALLVPETLSDFRSLLDFVDDMNVVPGLNVISADDFYRQSETFISLNPAGQNTYTWAKDLYGGTASTDWNRPYNQVFVANVVLDGLTKADRAGQETNWDTMQGSALFYRAFALYNLAQEFAVPYDPATAATAAGIPVRLSPDVNQIARRGTLAATYSRITEDLQTAADLLPMTQPLRNRPVRAAAFALLSRVYLTMQQYERSAAAASDALALNHTLLNYNNLNASASRPFPIPLTTANDEVIYYATVTSVSAYNSAAATLVDSALFRSYAGDDLRRTLFFNDRGNGNVVIKGNYTGSSAMFGGLSVDELYVNRAEAFARTNKLTEAVSDLNTLLATRWKTGAYQRYAGTVQQEILDRVLTERRKELVGRGLRWADLRRLNQEERYAKVLTRKVNGGTYTLAPGARNYTLPIPDNEVNASGIEQNPRD